MHEPLETSELLAFARTVDAKSLSRASEELRVPRATLRRRLARLEERLGIRLLRRTTRSLVLTEEGAVLYRHARIVLDAVATAEASVRRDDEVARGDLRVSVPPMIQDSFLRMLAAFGKAHPDVRLHVHFTTQRVDLARDGYDVALRAALDLEPGLVARTLARIPAVAVASPAYLGERGVPRSRKDLSAHRCLMGFERGEVPATYWPVPGGGKQHVDGAFFSNEPSMLCEAALQGLGIAMLPLVVVGPHLKSGALVQVLPEAIGAMTRIAVVYPEREFVPPHVRAFVDAVVAWAPTELQISLPPACKEMAAKFAKKAGGAKRGRTRRDRRKA